MPTLKLDHYNVWTRKLAETVAFYVDYLGLRVGDRPDFGVPGAWLYDATDTPVVHLIDVGNSTPEQILIAGDRDVTTLGGSGSIDHISFAATDFDVLSERLRAARLKYKEVKFPSLNLKQLFVEDPNGVMIELLFRGASVT